MNWIEASWIGFKFFFGMTGLIGGMVLLRRGIEQAASDRLEAVIRTLVKTPFRGLVTGGILTAILHSSAAVTLITMGLVGAGSMAFADSIGVILGSNIGTCLTTQLLSLRLEELIGPFLVLGCAVYLLTPKRPVWKALSAVLIGFGVLFLSLEWISSALEPLAGRDWFMHLLQLSSLNRWVGFAIGTLLTALLTSSTATTALTLTLASEHLITLQAAAAIVIGNNVGTCITAVLASFGSPLLVKRVALAHVLLNAAGAAVFLPLLVPFVRLVEWFSTDPGMQTATAHTLFNVISSLAILPFAKLFANAITRLLPEAG